MSKPADLLAIQLLNRLRLRSLVVFLAVLESGSITAAAKKVGLTQSAVSKKIQELEDLIGGPVFTREPTGTRPTLVGLATYAVCLRMKLMAEDYAQDLIDLQQRAKPRLSLGFAPGFYSRKMNQAVSHLAEIFPNVTITVYTMCRNELLNGLRCGNLTIGVGVNVADVRAPFEAIPVPPLRLAALISNVHPLMNSRSIEPIDGGQQVYRISELGAIAPFRWILPPGEEIISKAFKNAFDGTLLIPPLETTCFHEALMLTKETQFLMLLTEEALNMLLPMEGYSGIVFPKQIEVKEAVAAYCLEGSTNVAHSSMLSAFKRLAENSLIANASDATGYRA